MSEAPTGEGELARTPVAHLLVYALDRRLTGALFFTPPEGLGGETVVRLRRGVPIKIRPGDGFAPLGQMLIDAKAIDAATLEAALATKGLLGDVLLLTERIQRDVLEAIAAQQFMRRMVRLFTLPPATIYRYYDGHDALADYGGDPAAADPLAILWAGIRLHGEVSTLMEPTVARLGDAPLRLHPSTTVSRFGLDATEAPLLDALTGPRAGQITAPELCTRSFPGLVRRFLYGLAITRQLDAGPGLLPLGCETQPTSSKRWPTSPGTLGKVALKSTVHRVGAAAPDAPGAGERLPGPPRRRSASDPGIGDEPSSGSLSVESSGERAVPSEVGAASAKVPDSGVSERPARPTVAATAGAEEGDHPLDSLSPQELFWLAADYLEQSDVVSAVDACQLGCSKEPGDTSLRALSAWTRAHLDGADLSALATELDALVGEQPTHAEAHFYRAMLLRRMGDDAGSARDLRRALELDPAHAGAQRELAALTAASSPLVERSVFGRFSRG